MSAEQTAWDVVQDGLAGAMALLARTFDLATLVPEYAMAEWINQEVSQWRDLHKPEADNDEPEADSNILSDGTSPPHSPSRLQNTKENCSCCGRISIKVHAIIMAANHLILRRCKVGKAVLWLLKPSWLHNLLCCSRTLCTVHVKWLQSPTLMPPCTLMSPGTAIDM